eukprot:7661363-Ditylum_brightwellii.AAC.1
MHNHQKKKTIVHQLSKYQNNYDEIHVYSILFVHPIQRLYHLLFVVVPWHLLLFDLSHHQMIWRCGIGNVNLLMSVKSFHCRCFDLGKKRMKEDGESSERSLAWM